MKKQSKENMYRLLRELVDVLGISRITTMALESFIESIRQVKNKREEIDKLYFELADAIKHSEPNIIPLMHLLEQFENEMEEKLKPDMSLEEVGHIAIESLQEKIDQFEQKVQMVTSHGLKCIENGDVIIVQSASTAVLDTLIQAKTDQKKQFSVIILDYNPARTNQTIQVLTKYDIEHIIVADHNLSHHLGSANKMFVGAMTITADRQIVAPTGTAGTVSMCHYNDIKLYLLANTLHYSHRTADDQSIYKGIENGHTKNIDFSILTYSNDLVSLDLFDHVITENGNTLKTA